MDGLSPEAKAILAAAPRLPVAEDHWQAIVKAIGLSRQQAKIAECIARGLCHRQIALVMNISTSTIDDYLSRMARRTGTSGRVELINLLWAKSLEVRENTAG